MPGAGCARSLVCEMKEHTSVVTTVTPKTPGIPRAVVLTVSFVISPVIGFLATVVTRIVPRDLASASRCQDHTTSPSARNIIRLLISPRPPHPAPNVRDDRETSLYRDRTAGISI